jgi:hypothetical protein
MGVQQSNAFVPNFFGGWKEAFESIGDKIIGDDKDSDWHLRNAYAGWKNAFGEDPQAPELSQDQINQQRIKQDQDNLLRATNPNASWNVHNWQSVSSKGANSVYSNQAGTGGVAKPSDLLSISDPATKFLNSSVRGSAKSYLNVAKNYLDSGTAGSISSAMSGSAMPSDTINSGGGSGLATDHDAMGGQGVSQSVSSGN